MTEAVDDHPNSVAIAQANARLLRGLGREKLEEMVEACTLSTGGATSAVDDAAVNADGTATAVDDTALRDTTVPTAVRSARAARLFDELDPPLLPLTPAPPARQRVRNRTWGKFTLTHEV